MTMLLLKILFLLLLLHNTTVIIILGYSCYNTANIHVTNSTPKLLTVIYDTTPSITCTKACTTNTSAASVVAVVLSSVVH